MGHPDKGLLNLAQSERTSYHLARTQKTLPPTPIMAAFTAQKGFLGCNVLNSKATQLRRRAIVAHAGAYDEELIQTAVNLTICHVADYTICSEMQLGLKYLSQLFPSYAGYWKF